MVIQPSQKKDHKMKTNRLGCIEIDPKIIEEKLKAELGWSYLEGSIPSEDISHINIQEGSDSVFPREMFDVYVRGGDKGSPRFHVAGDGWDVAFFIANGKVHNICKRGSDMGILNKMRADVVKWLNLPCKLQPAITNGQNALLQWKQLHD